MKSMPFTCLDLCTPLFYSKIDNLPFEIHENDEFLLLFKLHPAQSKSIEPVRELLFEKLIFTGQKTADSCNIPDIDRFVLPEGKYLFTQQRGVSPMPEQNEILNMAIEQQKDALWERCKLKDQLYVRYLFEDGLFVTQLFREL